MLPSTQAPVSPQPAFNTWGAWPIGRLLALKPLPPLKHLFDPTATDKAAGHPCILIAKRPDYGIVLTATSTVYDDLVDRVQSEHALPLRHASLEHIAGTQLQFESRRDVAEYAEPSSDSSSGESSGSPDEDDVDESVLKHLRWKPDSTIKAGFLQFSRMYVVRPEEVMIFKEVGRHFKLDEESLTTVQTKLVQDEDISLLKQRGEEIMDAAESGESLWDVDCKYADLFRKLNMPQADRYVTYRAGRNMNFRGLEVDTEVSDESATEWKDSEAVEVVEIEAEVSAGSNSESESDTHPQGSGTGPQSDNWRTGSSPPRSPPPAYRLRRDTHVSPSAQAQQQQYSTHRDFRPLARMRSGTTSGSPWTNNRQSPPEAPQLPAARREPIQWVRVQNNTSESTPVPGSNHPQVASPTDSIRNRRGRSSTVSAFQPPNTPARPRFPPTASTSSSSSDSTASPTTFNPYAALDDAPSDDDTDIEEIVADLGHVSLDMSADAKALIARAPAVLRAGFTCVTHGGVKGVCACLWEMQSNEAVVRDVRARVAMNEEVAELLQHCRRGGDV